MATTTTIASELAGGGRTASPMTTGAMAPMMTLVLHLVFGAVLGWTYGKLASSSPPTAAAPG